MRALFPVTTVLSDQWPDFEEDLLDAGYILWTDFNGGYFSNQLDPSDVSFLNDLAAQHGIELNTLCTGETK